MNKLKFLTPKKYYSKRISFMKKTDRVIPIASKATDSKIQKEKAF
jgi:hypothetical protein